MVSQAVVLQEHEVPECLQSFSKDLFEAFLASKAPRPTHQLPALSMFSNVGLGDYGFRLAGYEFKAHAELLENRLDVCALNHPEGKAVLGDLREEWRKLVEEYKGTGAGRPTLLTAMSPCQGMSTASNYDRVGKKGNVSTDERNTLPFVVADVAAELQPRVIVFENVPGVFTTRVEDPETHEVGEIPALLQKRLEDYACFPVIIQFADFGVPQRRRRALLTFIHEDEPCLELLDEHDATPYPRRTHSDGGKDGLLEWITVEEFLKGRFKKLDASSEEASRDPHDPLHVVPHYDEKRYSLVSGIPPRSARSAYDTTTCQDCGHEDIEKELAVCPACSNPLHCRPIVKDEDTGEWRLITGHHTSYKRMPHDRPATTVITASGHLGSDNKIHPWENRLLSPRECAALQTVPKDFQWVPEGKRLHLGNVREPVGEAIPCWFTYLHGHVLRNLLAGNEAVASYLMKRQDVPADAGAKALAKCKTEPGPAITACVAPATTGT